MFGFRQVKFRNLRTCQYCSCLLLSESTQWMWQNYPSFAVFLHTLNVATVSFSFVVLLYSVNAAALSVQSDVETASLSFVV